MKTLVIAVALLLNFQTLYAKMLTDSSKRMAIGIDLSLYDGYVYSNIKTYRFGVDFTYRITTNWSAHLAAFYNKTDAHDYSKRNHFNQLAYTFKFGPEYTLPLWKASYHPSLVFNTNISVMSIRTNAEYRIENQYYPGQISEVYNNPLKRYLFYDFGVGVQAEYKRFRVKVQGFATPISTWNKFTRDQKEGNANKLNNTNNYIPGYGFENTTLFGNMFLYYTF